MSTIAISSASSASAPSESRESLNNRALLQPPAKAEGIQLRPMSLGSLEILRQLGNPLCSPDADMAGVDTRAMVELVWVHAAPVDEVLDTVYNSPSDVARKAARFALSVSPAALQEIARAMAFDRAAVASASAEPIPDPDLPDSKNAPAPRL